MSKDTNKKQQKKRATWLLAKKVDRFYHLLHVEAPAPSNGRRQKYAGARSFLSAVNFVLSFVNNKSNYRNPEK